jgi:hypothetical protein
MDFSWVKKSIFFLSFLRKLIILNSDNDNHFHSEIRERIGGGKQMSVKKRKYPFRVVMSVGLASVLAFLSGCGASEQAASTNQVTSGKAEEKKQGITVPVKDYTFDTAGNMFAYAEFELSGEPMVEALGLNLDVLDPAKVDQPSVFDYTAGIESYEYSEEAMYEVVEKSGLGLHMVHAPEVKRLAQQAGKKENETLAHRFVELADAVGYAPEEITRNMYPTFIEYSKADPHYIQPVDTGKFADGENGTYIPKYQVDFASLRWDRAKMDKTLTPAAYGATFLKQALWAGDFLGGTHKKDTDEELEAKTSTDDKDPNIRLGVSSVDGMQGMILAEQMWNKTSYIRDNLFYNPQTKKLEKATGAAYDPKKKLVYLPHAILVAENGEKEYVNAQSLEVKDARSLLKDQWLMLWPAAEYFGMTDQRAANTNTNPAFRAVYDGKPFPAAPKQNTDNLTDNDVVSNDPYSVNRDIMLQVFKNIEAMHWNEKEGIFVDEHDGQKAGKHMDMFDAGYTLEALRIFQRAVDGLPVGYASGDDAKGLDTQEGKAALAMIKKQADFILANMIDEQGLVANGWTIGEGKDKEEPTLLAQTGAIRGLTAAFLATKEEKYREAARKIYAAMDQTMWDAEAKAYKTSGDKYEYDAFTAGAVSGAFRMAIASLHNIATDKEKLPALERKTIISRYVDFYNQVIDGPALDQGMQASEFWDTGDFYKEGDKSGNTDNDNVPQIQAGHGQHGIAPVLLSVEVKKEGK